MGYTYKIKVSTIYKQTPLWMSFQKTLHLSSVHTICYWSCVSFNIRFQQCIRHDIISPYFESPWKCLLSPYQFVCPQHWIMLLLNAIEKISECILKKNQLKCFVSIYLVIYKLLKFKCILFNFLFDQTCDFSCVAACRTWPAHLLFLF